jgi:hypothetical protein
MGSRISHKTTAIRRRISTVGASILTLAATTASLSIVGLAAASPASAKVNGAVSTTDDPGYQYGGGYTAQACLNGNGTNCNIYQDKRDVFLSGLPVQASLGAGNYFFAVLDPGSQADPNDGSTGNLSSNHDAWTNREFSVDGAGAITYSGTHAFDPGNNKLSLFPYDDTSNPGGVYILAVCAVPDNAGTGPGTPGVNPSDCKYDAFKVGGQTVAAHALTITKDANGSDTNTFTWGIQKSVDETLVKQSSGTAAFNYTVTVTHDSGTISNVKVTGTIDVFNPNVDSSNNPLPVTIDGVTDKLSDGTVCTVTNGGSQTLTQAHTSFSYVCDLSALPQGELDNTATVSWSDQVLNDGSVLGGDSADFTFKNIVFAETKVNDCATVTDTLAPPSSGLPTTLCSTDPSPATFTYSHTYSGDPAGTCTKHDNTATFTTTGPNASSPPVTDSKSTEVQVCVGADLVVTKDATPHFTRTYTWSIEKDLANGQNPVVDASSDPVTANYLVKLSHDNGTDSGWKVTGTVNVANPNSWEDIPFSLSDSIDNGGSCTFDSAPPAVVPANTTVHVPYTCLYGSQPAYNTQFTNSATATWDASAAFTSDGSNTGTASGQFSQPDKVRGDTAVVSDSLAGQLPGPGPSGQFDVSQTSPILIPYSVQLTGDTPGTCTHHPNVATFTDSLGNQGSSGANVDVCLGEDLSVVKTAKPSFDRKYNWVISKTANKTSIIGGHVTYTVTVGQDNSNGGANLFTDSNWQVKGTITVTNPNNFEAIAPTGVSDIVNNGGVCTVDTSGLPAGGIPALSQAVLPYSCTYAVKPSPLAGTNYAQAFWDASAANTPDGSSNIATAPFDFGPPLAPTNVTNKNITVTDSQGGTLGPAGPANDQGTYTKSFTYTKFFPEGGNPCTLINNTATITQTGQNAKFSVSNCSLGALTMGYWHNMNGQAVIKAAPNPPALGSYLFNLGLVPGPGQPFKDLPGGASATNAQVATYDVSVWSIANAAGNGAPMLKAQLLATALNVDLYAQIGAPAPIGTAVIDLTNVGGTNVSAAFGGATSMSINDMIVWTAAHSNAGGTAFYGGNKNLTTLAITAFNGINNDIVTGP